MTLDLLFILINILVQEFHSITLSKISHLESMLNATLNIDRLALLPGIIATLRYLTIVKLNIYANQTCLTM